MIGAVYSLGVTPDSGFCACACAWTWTWTCVEQGQYQRRLLGEDEFQLSALQLDCANVLHVGDLGASDH